MEGRFKNKYGDDKYSYSFYNRCKIFIFKTNRKKSKNIDDSIIITFFHLKLNDKNSQSLLNQVSYQQYNYNRKILDLTVYNNTNI